MKKNMKILIYLYWRLLEHSKTQVKHYQNANAVLSLVAFIAVHILSLMLFIDSIHHSSFRNLNGWIGHNSVENRLFKIPILLVPILLVILLFYNRNKKKINDELLRLDNMTIEEKREKNKYFIAYFVATLILFFLAMASPAYIK